GTGQAAQSHLTIRNGLQRANMPPCNRLRVLVYSLPSTLRSDCPHLCSPPRACRTYSGLYALVGSAHRLAEDETREPRRAKRGLSYSQAQVKTFTSPLQSVSTACAERTSQSHRSNACLVRGTCALRCGPGA